MLNYYKLNKIRIVKIIIFSIILFFCVASILNVVISSDIEHILHCHKDKCVYCEIIRICQFQSANTIVIMLTIPLLCALNRNIILKSFTRICKTITLINTKIQLNI
ncbi:MAG: hypothetical protein IJH39_03370 [Clostridia bacterium]|nr:hypothetical protein [Clostridia bacterium]